MRFGLCVRLGVDLHVRLTEEGRRTHPAPTGGETQKWEERDGRTRRKKGDTHTEKDKQETMMEKERRKEMKVVGRRRGGMKH